MTNAIESYECTGCGASPCDCDEPIWSWRETTDDTWEWSLYGGGRREALRLHSLRPGQPNRGPVQRMTEPHFEDLIAGRPTPPLTTRLRLSARRIEWLPVGERIDFGQAGDERVATVSIREDGVQVQLPRVTQADLARLLFEASRGVEARLGAVLEPGADAARRRQVLDVMWAGKDGKKATLPVERAEAERLAASVCKSIQAAPPAPAIKHETAAAHAGTQFATLLEEALARAGTPRD